jgi:hypothetical protein
MADIGQESKRSTSQIRPIRNEGAKKPMKSTTGARQDIRSYHYTDKETTHALRGQTSHHIPTQL